MNGMTDWIQNNWFEFGSLSLQFATLVALVWFARNLLKIMVASPRRVEAPREFTESPAMEAQPFHGGMRGLIPLESATGPRESVSFGRPERRDVWSSVIKWLNTPMGNAPMVWRRYGLRRVS